MHTCVRLRQAAPSTLQRQSTGSAAQQQQAPHIALIGLSKQRWPLHCNTSCPHHIKAVFFEALSPDMSSKHKWHPTVPTGCTGASAVQKSADPSIDTSCPTRKSSTLETKVAQSCTRDTNGIKLRQCFWERPHEHTAVAAPTHWPHATPHRCNDTARL